MSYTGTTFKALVATLLDRTDLTTSIVTWCGQAVKELEEECFWFQLASTTVSTADGVGYASLPTGFLRELKDGFRDTDGDALIKESWSRVDYWQKFDTSEAEPEWYAIADKFYFFHIPDSIYALPLQYYKSLGFPADGVSNAWTDEVWDLTLHTVMEKAWSYLNNTSETAKSVNEKILALNRYRSRSGKLTGRGTVRYRDW